MSTNQQYKAMSANVNVDLKANNNENGQEKEIELENINIEIERSANFMSENKVSKIEKSKLSSNDVNVRTKLTDGCGANPDLAVVAKEEYNRERVFFLQRNKRIAIFIFVITINIIANLDDGTIPAATVEIKEKLKIGDDMVGLLGTLVYVGNLIGKFYL